MATQYRTKNADCPKCGRGNDRSTGMEGDEAPNPGDVSVCFGCHFVGIYADDLSIREPTDAEKKELKEPENAKRVAAVIRRIRELKR